MSQGAGTGQVRGELHPAAKLRERDVRRLRQLARKIPPRGRGWWFATIARRRRMARSSVVEAIYGRTWSHVPGALRPPRRPR